MHINLNQFNSPILLKGSKNTAYRDPAVIYHNETFYLYYTYVKTSNKGDVYMYTAMSKSNDLLNWTEPVKLTPKDQNLNFSSPGNIIRYNGKWIMCLQTYPRPNGKKFGNTNSRIWLMESDDLENWKEPKIMKVKGSKVPLRNMGRMIDPYLIQDKDTPEKWWCFYKQNGASMSFSYDLKNWTYYDNIKAGENVCVLIKNDSYFLFHSPENGIGIKKSKNLDDWKDLELFTLNQKNWPWAQGRLTAGFVLDCRQVKGIKKYLLFFHGVPQYESTTFDTHASIGFAWSDNLFNWKWIE